MYRNWISIRIKRFSKAIYIKPEYMDLDCVVDAGIIERVVLPYKDSSGSMLTALLERHKEKGLVKSFKELMESGTMYCYYSKPQDSYLLITDTPELYRGLFDPEATAHLRETASKSFSVFVLEDTTTRTQDTAYVYNPGASPYEFVVIGTYGDGAAYKLINVLAEIGQKYNRIPVTPVPPKIVNTAISCPTYTIKDLESKEDLVRFNYFVGRSTIQGKSEVFSVNTKDGIPKDVSVKNHIRLNYGLFEFSYADAERVYKLVDKVNAGASNYCVISGVKFIAKAPITGFDNYEAAFSNVYARCVQHQILTYSPYICGLFRRDILESRKVPYTERESVAARYSTTDAIPFGDRNDTHTPVLTNKYTPTINTLFPLVNETISVRRPKIPTTTKGTAGNNLLNFVDFTLGPIGGIGGYVVELHSPEEGVFTNCCVSESLYSQMSGKTLKEYTEGCILPSVFTEKFSVMRDGIRRMLGVESPKDLPVSEESFIQDNTPLLL